MKLIPSRDNSVEPRGAIGKQMCGIIFWQKTGFLRHCSEPGLRSVVYLIERKYKPSSIQNNGNDYFIEFDKNEEKVIFLSLKKERNSRHSFIYGESHTVYAGHEFHIFALEIVEYISRQIGCRFYVDDATGYLESRSVEDLKNYIENYTKNRTTARDTERSVNMKLSVIFEEEPETWGYRGDTYFWRYLKEHAENMDIVSPEELEAWIKKEFFSVAGKELTDVPGDIAVVEQFAHGGMSSGGIENMWWVETGIPLLKSRLTAL